MIEYIRKHDTLREHIHKGKSVVLCSGFLQPFPKNQIRDTSTKKHQHAYGHLFS